MFSMDSQKAATSTDRAAAERQFFNEYAEQLDRIKVDPALAFAPT
jgi:hypothetical protein